MTHTRTADKPGTRTVHVWTAPLEGPPAFLGRLAASLSEHERERAGRFRFVRDARRFSAARGWLRAVLGAELGVPPGAVRLSEDGAKPRLVDESGLHFNVAHADDLVVIAVSSSPVGVDVEPVEPTTLDPGPVGVACTTAEAEALGRLAVEDQALALLRLWTAKEAYLKATGEGLSVPPSSVEVGLSRPEEGTPVQVAGDPGGGHWWVRELRPAAGFIGAVASEGPDWQVRLRSTAEIARGSAAGARVQTADR